MKRLIGRYRNVEIKKRAITSPKTAMTLTANVLTNGNTLAPLL